MKKSNKFIKNCIVEALLSLMEEKDFKDISITEITKKAGVSRMYYYRNYYNKEDILNDYMTELIEEYHLRRKNKENSAYLLMLCAFEYFKEHKDFIIALEKSNLSNIIQNKINDYMGIFYPDHKEEIVSQYRLYILSGALYNTCKMWLLSGAKETPEELAKIFVDRMF